MKNLHNQYGPDTCCRTQRAAGTVIDVSGRVLSVKGYAVQGALIEIWQADAGGRYKHRGDTNHSPRRDANFQGYGIVRTGFRGAYRFHTIRPRSYETGMGPRTPHIHFRIVTPDRQELVTQMYFPDESMNQLDLVYLNLANDIKKQAATARLVKGSPDAFHFDIVFA